MVTTNQLIRGIRKDKKRSSKNDVLKIIRNSLKGTFKYSPSPQKSGICKIVGKLKPRKPNSSLKSYAKVLLSNGRRINIYIPGEGHNLQEYSSVLIFGGGAQDLSGTNYSAIRGKLDLEGVKGRKQGRSIYGTKKEIK